ncbi:MAG: phytoene/squalene synthase family protein [Bauldia sp.]|nr:phytoene/squalene synthase family protein [Bauldia sp.]
MDAYEEAQKTVRERDRDRFLADLFAPVPARKHLFALHAFNAEIVRIQNLVSDPTLGEIRQEWWREALQGRGGEGNPVAEAIIATIGACTLPVAAFIALIDARTFDLYNDPMPTFRDFEGYAGETTSSLFQLGSLILNGGADPGSADAAGHAGVAMALTRALWRLPYDAGQRRVFLPRDRLAAHGVDLEDLFAWKPSLGLEAAFAEFAGTARGHLVQARQALARLPATLAPAFLPLALVERDLDALGRLDVLLAARAEPPQWRRQWALWRASKRWPV